MITLDIGFQPSTNSTRTISLFLIALMVAFGVMAQGSPVGTWKTIDDVDGKATSHVEIYEKNGSLHAKIVKLLVEPEDSRCENCNGNKKDQPIQGMEIMWNMKAFKNAWKGGQVMDPKNGKSYKCKLTLVEKDLLEVRGYIGLSLIGRTQKWYRLQ